MREVPGSNPGRARDLFVLPSTKSVTDKYYAYMSVCIYILDYILSDTKDLGSFEPKFVSISSGDCIGMDPHRDLFIFIVARLSICFWLQM